jgi:hypothetical protein
MTTDLERDDEAALEAFFVAGRQAPAVPQDVLARVLADAAAVQAAARPAVRPALGPAIGRIGGLLAAIGGWPVMAGLATATVAGLWFGYAAPTEVDPYLGLASTYGLADLMPSLTDLTSGG